MAPKMTAMPMTANRTAVRFFMVASPENSPTPITQFGQEVAHKIMKSQRNHGCVWR